MSTYVLVPGACHGGWYYDEVAAALVARGHRAVPVTLTGVGGGPAGDGVVDLSTHIDEVTALVREHSEVILVGHSYGGMVVSGVADRAGEHVDALVYLDAFVPVDGDSCSMLTTDQQRAWYATGEADGVVPRLPFFDPRTTGHPLAALRQPISLRGDLSRFRRRDYVYATIWHGEPSPFAPTRDRLAADPSWTVHDAASTHSLRDASDLVRDVLLDAAR